MARHIVHHKLVNRGESQRSQRQSKIVPGPADVPHLLESASILMLSAYQRKQAPKRNL